MAKKATTARPAAKTLVRDGLENLLSGLGVAGQDKAVSSFFADPILTDDQAHNIYRGTWLGRKLIDIPAEDMTREWRRWQATNEQIEKIEAEERRLGLQSKMADAIRWARLYGGAGIVIGDGSADPSLPLDPKTITAGGLRYLAVVTKDVLSAEETVFDVGSDLYLRPSMWVMQSARGARVRLHPSRVVIFYGAKRPPLKAMHDGWGDSVLMAAYEAIRNASTGSSVINALLHEAKMDVITIPDLSDALSTPDGESRLLQRFYLAKLSKSLVNTLILGSGEEFQQKSLTFTGLPDIHMRFMQEAAGAVDMPVTRLMGQSPAGLSSTGESDLRNWYDKIAKDQTQILRPALDHIDACLLRSALGPTPPAEIFYTFPPLWQLTPEQAADVAVKKSAVFTADVNSGLIPDEALATGRVNQLIEDGIYPGFEQAIDDAKEEQGGTLIPEEPEPEIDPATGQPVPPGGTQPPRGQTMTGGEDDPAVPRGRTLKIAVSNDGRSAEEIFADATPRTLYIRRDVTNWQSLASWAKAQGFKTTVGKEMHVTVAYSRSPVDWTKVSDWSLWGQDENGKMTIAPGGMRMVERLGAKATCLLFNSSALAGRHRSICDHPDVSWDFDDYQPHVTISFDVPADVDLRKFEPYRGAIILGPEIWEEVGESWAAGIVEDGVGAT